MNIFKNKFLQIQYEQDNNICIGNWTIETKNAEKDDFKSWNKELVKKFQENNPSGFLANTKNYKFVISPDLQEWSVSNVFELFAKAGL